MKKQFSTSWIGSKQPRKQRKYRHNAPLHLRHKFLNAKLSKELSKKYSKSSLPLRTGDEVLVMRGKFAKKKAKIVSVDMKRTRVVLENLNRTKVDGTKVNVYFSPSNLMILSLNVEDKKRLKRSRGRETAEKPEKKTEKVEKKTEEKKSDKSEIKENKNGTSDKS